MDQLTWTPIMNLWNKISIEKDVNPNDILLLPECQPRVKGIDPKIVEEYATDMREYDDKGNIQGWKVFPQLSCVKTPDVEIILVSGFHRLEAIIDVGYEKINVCYVEGTRQDAIMLSKQENKNNGIRRTNADKEHVVKSCLLDPELCQWTDSQIAKWCGVAPNTVRNYEKSLCNLHSENYERPVRRKSFNKHGEVEMIDTSAIGKHTLKPKTDDRETNKLLKQKQKIFKEIWDKRKQVAKYYIGDGDTELNQYLTLEQLEKGFAKNHKYCADAFRWTMERTAFPTFQLCFDRALELEDDVSIDRLQEAQNAVSTYAYDIFTWHKIDWIQALITSKKGGSQTDTEQPSDVTKTEPAKPSIGEMIEPIEEDVIEQDKTKIELERARSTAEEARLALWTARDEVFGLRDYGETDLSKHTGPKEFAIAACKAYGYEITGAHRSPENYILGNELALVKDLNILQARTWRSRFEAITGSITGEADWVKALLPPEITEELKQAIRDDITKARAETDNGNGSGVNGMKYKPIAERHNVPVELVAEIAKEPQPPPIVQESTETVKPVLQVVPQPATTDMKRYGVKLFLYNPPNANNTLNGSSIPVKIWEGNKVASDKHISEETLLSIMEALTQVLEDQLK